MNNTDLVKDIGLECGCGFTISIENNKKAFTTSFCQKHQLELFPTKQDWKEVLNDELGLFVIVNRWD